MIKNIFSLKMQQWYMIILMNMKKLLNTMTKSYMNLKQLIKSEFLKGLFISW